jgi:hypothetical protein
MTFAVGSTYVFLIERISQDKGLYAPYSIIRAGERIFFLNNTGFHLIAPGTNYPQQLGKEKFDRYFLQILDRSQLQVVIGAADPKNSRIFWSFRGAGMAASTYTALLCYDYALDRATIMGMNGEYLMQIAQPGVTLEGLDTVAPSALLRSSGQGVTASADNGSGKTRLTISPGVSSLASSTQLTLFDVTGGLTSAVDPIISNRGTYNYTVIDSTHVDLTTLNYSGSSGTASIGGSLDAMAASFDSFVPSTAPEIAQFDNSHKLAFFGGAPIEAIMDTAEEGTDGQRLRVQGIRPITDAATFFASCSRRETVQASASYVTESAPTRTGICPLNVSTRYSRGRVRIPAGTNWTFAAGIEPQFAIEGLA